MKIAIQRKTHLQLHLSIILNATLTNVVLDILLTCTVVRIRVLGGLGLGEVRRVCILQDKKTLCEPVLKGVAITLLSTTVAAQNCSKLQIMT